MIDPEFTLYDLKVTLVHTRDGRRALSRQEDGTYFLAEGENLIFPCGNHSFPLYALAALLPLLPAKQRETAATDWMTSDAIIADPDPHSGIQYRIERIGRRTFKRGDVTATLISDKE
jgi:uncharacterized repeat protein (TIGR04076 family)